ncbi:MAG: sulfite oxidase-like oxidoreductase [Methanobacterium sp.]|nr:sulfite oxidase-like oxidoreductase [Methanobacterium sp.]
MKFFKSPGRKSKEEEFIKASLEDEEVIISPDTKREVRIPPGQKKINKWPVLHAGKVPKIDLSNWKFKITGLVSEEKEYTLKEFRKLSQIKVFSDIHCVTSWSKLNNIWQGISTSVLKKEVNILPQAKYVLIHAEGNFTTNLSLEDFFKEDVIFATHHNGKQLNIKHGYPLRLVVPQLYLWKSAKWVNGVEFIEEDKPGFWESNGYHMHGDPWKEERYSWQNR